MYSVYACALTIGEILFSFMDVLHKSHLVQTCRQGKLHYLFMALLVLDSGNGVEYDWSNQESNPRQSHPVATVRYNYL